MVSPDDIASLKVEMKKLAAAVEGLALKLAAQGEIEYSKLPWFTPHYVVGDSIKLKGSHLSTTTTTTTTQSGNNEVTKDSMGSNPQKSSNTTINTQQVFDKIPEPNSGLSQVQMGGTNLRGVHSPVIASLPISYHINSDTDLIDPILSPRAFKKSVDEDWQIYKNNEVQDSVCVIGQEIGYNHTQDEQMPDTHQVLDQFPIPTFILEMAQAAKAAELNFIRKMAQGAKVEGDKSGECDHEQHIGCNSSEDEEIPNADHTFDEMCQLENESIPRETTTMHVNPVMPSLVRVITKPFLQFPAIETRYLSPDKIFGSLARGQWPNNISWFPHFQHNYDLLSNHYTETEYDGDVSIPKGTIWFHPFNLSRMILLIDSNVFGLQICLLHADFDPELIIFDPRGYLCSLVVPSALDDGHKLICLFTTNTLNSTYYINAFLVTTDISELLDCILSITLEDKGVLKGKEDMVHVGSSSRLHHTIFLRLFSTSSWINILPYVFNPSVLHCQCALWDDYPHSFWLFVVISLALGVCQGRGDCVHTIHSIMCTMKLGGKHLTTTSDIFVIMTVSSYTSEGELNGKHDIYMWSSSKILNMYFDSNNVRMNKNLLLLTHVFDMSILRRQCSVWSGHPYDSCWSLAQSLTWCVCIGRSDMGDIANTLEKLSTLSMVWCMTYNICLNISVELTMSLYHSKFATALKFFANFRSNTPLSAGNVLKIKKQHSLFPTNSHDTMVKLFLKYFVYEPLQQGLRIAEFECEKGYGKLVTIVSFSLIIIGASCSEVLMSLYKARWLKLIVGHTNVDIPGASTHLLGISSSAWLKFATYTLINEVIPTNGISQSKMLHGAVWPLKLFTSEYVSEGMGTVNMNVANLGIPPFGSILVHAQVQPLFLEVPTVRLQWKPGLLLLYSVQIYAHAILVFDPGGWYMATCLCFAVRLHATSLILEDKERATRLILEDKDHFMGWVMIHTKNIMEGRLVIYVFNCLFPKIIRL